MPDIVRINCKSQNRIDQIKKMLYMYSVIKQVSPSDQQITLMAYIIVYGGAQKIRPFIVDKLKMYANHDTYGRAVNKLFNFGFLERGDDRGEYVVHPGIKLQSKGDIVLLINIKQPIVELSENGINNQP